MQTPGKAASFWIDQFRATHYPALDADMEADVAVVGAGIVGLTAALQLKRAGLKVVVIDALRAGQQVTGRSTAKVTSQHSLIYNTLISKFGEDGARTYAQSNEQAIEHIAGLVRDLNIDCDFERRPSYTVSITGAKLKDVQQEVEAAQRLGLPASFVDKMPLPFPIAGAVRFDNQAQFNSAKYTAGLADSIPGEGCAVFEMTRVDDIEHGEPCLVRTARGTIRARDVIIATNIPIINDGFYWARAFPRAHAAMAARLADRAEAPELMFITVDEEPTHSYRTAQGADGRYLVCASGAYKPGQEDELRDRVEDLERWIRGNFTVSSIDYTWTNEDYDSMDRVPFVGHPTDGREHFYIATGFNAWGMTAGTVAGMILADLVRGRENSWASLYDANRIKPVAGGPKFVAENVQVAKHFIAGWLSGSGVKSPEELAIGDSAVMKWQGDQVAAYRDDEGHLHVVSAVCTHMGCTLGWNGVDRSWDCPCHGSRFSFRGEVLHGPAKTPLKVHQTDTARPVRDGETAVGQGGAGAGPGRPRDNKVDIASDQSFPASDPPNFNPGHPAPEKKAD